MARFLLDCEYGFNLENIAEKITAEILEVMEDVFEKSANQRLVYDYTEFDSGIVVAKGQIECYGDYFRENATHDEPGENRKELYYVIPDNNEFRSEVQRQLCDRLGNYKFNLSQYVNDEDFFFDVLTSDIEAELKEDD